MQSDYEAALAWRRAALEDGWKEIDFREVETLLRFVLTRGKRRALVLLRRGTEGEVVCFEPGRRRYEPILPYEPGEFGDG